jgi:MFS family permease
MIDRIGARSWMILCFLPMILSLFGFLVLHSPAALFVAVVVYGIGHGGFFTIVSPTVAVFFGL